jgi:recombination protein RecR
MEKLPEDLLSLISLLKKLPGVGIRTAERFAFEFLSWPKADLETLSELLSSAQAKVPPCPECGCLTDTSKLCLIASARDAFAIEATKCYRGLYHVIEHLLSPLDGRHASMLRLDRIEERIAKHSIREAIIAFDSTLEGDTTALFLKKHLGSRPELQVSRLAFGLPVGSSLEYIDGGTLTRALAGRQTF